MEKVAQTKALKVMECLGLYKPKNEVFYIAMSIGIPILMMWLIFTAIGFVWNCAEFSMVEAIEYLTTTMGSAAQVLIVLFILMLFGSDTKDIFHFSNNHAEIREAERLFTLLTPEELDYLCGTLDDNSPDIKSYRASVAARLTRLEVLDAHRKLQERAATPSLQK